MHTKVFFILSPQFQLLFACKMRMPSSQGSVQTFFSRGGKDYVTYGTFVQDNMYQILSGSAGWKK